MAWISLDMMMILHLCPSLKRYQQTLIRKKKELQQRLHLVQPEQKRQMFMWSPHRQELGCHYMRLFMLIGLLETKGCAMILACNGETDCDLAGGDLVGI